MKTFYFSTLLFFWLGLVHAQNTDDVLKFSMTTPWSDDINESQPWDLYPRPQMERVNWQNLNGYWDYAIRPMEAGQPNEYDGKILVPYAVESELSGVKKLVSENHYLWYRTNFDVNDLQKDQKLHINFGAVDWEAVVYLNGKVVGGHKGGYTPFSLNLTPHLKKGGQELVVRVWDPTDKGTQARGKQVQNPRGIWYTPVTGIWQTVWLEKTAQDHIKLLKNTPDVDQSMVRIEMETSVLSEDMDIIATVTKNGEKISSQKSRLSAGSEFIGLEIPMENPTLWSPENPFLYDLNLKLVSSEGRTVDEVKSYFGMRKISLGKGPNGYTRILLNDKPLFQFGLLDQGWWPDGLYTAPTEEAMMFDVKMTKAMGFNMLRKHVKVEPARFYYNCDKMGMLVWQDMPNGNYFQELRIQAWELEDAKRPFESAVQFEKELKEMMDHFHSFPSILVWVPFNEGWGQYDTERVTKWTIAYDPSRLVDSPSGWTDRGVGHIIDTHIYPGPGMELPEENRASIVGEFGGLGLTVDDHMWWDKKNWGYLTYHDKEKFVARFEALIEDLKGMKSFGLSGAIYTQTTDVEGEVNGLMTYDREVIKVDTLKTKELFAPLYEKAVPHHVLIKDSEESANHWLVNTDAEDDWYKSADKKGAWQEKAAPFSSHDNFFLPKGSNWEANKDLFLVKEFKVEDVPEKFHLRYYLEKAKMQVYLNGKMVTEEKDEGGRKRHYRNKTITNASQYLRKGTNVIAIKVKGREKHQSFDLGMYTNSK